MLRRFGKGLLGAYIDYRFIDSTMDVSKWLQIFKLYVKEKKVCVIPSDFCTVGWSERFLTDWFKTNFERIGFKEILGERTEKYNTLKKQMRFYGFPDFLVKRDTPWERLEIECFASDYHHGDGYAEVVLCYEKDVDLQAQEIIEFKRLNGCESIILDSEIWQYLYLIDSNFKKEYDEKLTEEWSKKTE